MQNLDDRLRTAYAQAMRQAHDSGRVEIHIGIHVLDYLRSFCVKDTPLGQAPTVWGLPLKVRDSFPPEHIEVHTVHFIP